MTFVPPAGLGPFAFPAPYNTRGIRLTNASNAPRGVPPRVYPYYSIVNNHAGQGHLWVIAGRVGLPPALLRVDKASGAVSLERELPTQSEAEGWFFSDRDASTFFCLEGPSLHRFHVDEGRNDIVFTLDPKIGDDLWQLHNSADDTVHSATVRRRRNDGPYEVLGCVVVIRGEQRFFPLQTPADDYDECIVTKDGRWLIVQEKVDVDGRKRGRNRIHDLAHPEAPPRIITDRDGALGHLDVGHDFAIGEDDSGDRWQMVRWNMAALGSKTVLMIGPAEWKNGVGHVAVRDNLVLHSSNDTGELWTLPADGTGGRTLIAPGFMDGHNYDYQLKAVLDPTGEYAAWVAELEGRLDLLLVQLPTVGEPPIIVTPPDVHPPDPPRPGGPMRQLTIFTQPDEATVHLRHDSGAEFDATSGMADGRPAHLLSIDDELVSRGHGAELTIDWQGNALVQHGFLRPSPNGQAEFIGDVFHEPKGF